MLDPFDELLSWLDSDREAAAKKYETIRGGLIKVFLCKGFCDAEDMADTTINRVTTRLRQIRDDYVGDPANYFYGVSRYIIHEAKRRKEIAFDMTDIVASQAEISGEAECLNACLQLLSANQRELILEYYLYGGADKIDHRKQLANEFGIDLRNLRVRAYRIRATLQKCIRERLGTFSTAINDGPLRIIHKGSPDQQL